MSIFTKIKSYVLDKVDKNVVVNNDTMDIEKIKVDAVNDALYYALIAGMTFERFCQDLTRDEKDDGIKRLYNTIIEKKITKGFLNNVVENTIGLCDELGIKKV